MNAGTREMVERSLRTRSVEATASLFSSSLCSPVSVTQVRKVKRLMVARERQERRRTSSQAVAKEIGLDDNGAASARQGCQSLLRAMLKAGQHTLGMAQALERGAALGLAINEIRPGVAL